MGSVNFKHSYTYTPDAAAATAVLGNTEDAFNQVWHLPTAPNPFTGKEWMDPNGDGGFMIWIWGLAAMGKPGMTAIY